MLQRMLISFLIPVLCWNSSYAQEAAAADVVALRKLYYASYKDKTAAEALKKCTEANKQPSAIWLGYRAAAHIMMCNHVANPYTKLKYFYNGRNELERSIKANAGDAELRYLRYAVQCNTPAVLNYKDNIKVDKAILDKYLQHVANKEKDPDLYQRISDYMKRHPITEQ